jgi:hypothetical protein
LPKNLTQLIPPYALPPWWRKERGVMPCERLWSGYTKAALATLPCPHDWTG